MYGKIEENFEFSLYWIDPVLPVGYFASTGTKMQVYANMFTI